jgi:two-component sensor histidine kinase
MQRWRAFDAEGKPVAPSQWPSSRALRGETVVPGTEFIFTGDDGTEVWTRVAAAPFTDTAGVTGGAVVVVEDIDQLKRAEEQVMLIAHELEHRTKNILAKVTAIIRLTRADTISDYVQAIQSRVDALARTHTLLSNKRWQGAEVKGLIDDEIGACATGREERIHVSGPRFLLSATGAESFGMVMHELTTNAVKYGALSRPEGRLTVEWSQPEKEELVVDWVESGIPLDPAPTHTGFGTRLINLIVERQLAGKVDFDWQNDGLHCRIAVPTEPLRPRA